MMARAMTRNTMAMFAAVMVAVATACLLGLCFHAEKAYAVSDPYSPWGTALFAICSKEIIILLEINGQTQGYLFQCLHCGRYLLWVDAD